MTADAVPHKRQLRTGFILLSPIISSQSASCVYYTSVFMTAMEEEKNLSLKKASYLLPLDNCSPIS